MVGPIALLGGEEGVLLNYMFLFNCLCFQNVEFISLFNSYSIITQNKMNNVNNNL